MKNPIKRYSFWFKIVAAALLLVLGLWIIFDKSLGETLVLGFSAALVLLFAVIRIIPLMKTLKSGKAKLISMLEIIINIVLSAVMFYAAINIQRNQDNKIAQFASDYYNYFIGGILYLRGLVYFMISILYKEDSDRTKFWVHMTVLTLGVICIGINDSIATKLSLAIAIIALICFAGLVVDGGFAYGKYRKYVKQQREVNEIKEVIEEESKKAPTRKERKNKKIEEPEIKEEPKIEPTNDNDQPYVV